MLPFSSSILLGLQFRWFVNIIITPEVIFRKKKEAFIVELVRLHQNTELGRRLHVYDGGKNLYTAGSLPFTHKEFNIVLNEDDEGASSTSYVSLGRLLYSLGRLLGRPRCFGSSMLNRKRPTWIFPKTRYNLTVLTVHIM
ncbi:protein argonaute PNH1 [Trifolium repens]|nr:protein argonaute PNH1 [Trifolium repens]